MVEGLGFYKELYGDYYRGDKGDTKSLDYNSHVGNQEFRP